MTRACFYIIWYAWITLEKVSPRATGSSFLLFMRMAVTLASGRSPARQDEVTDLGNGHVILHLPGARDGACSYSYTCGSRTDTTDAGG